MDKFKLCSGSVYGKSCYDKDALKDVFLHGETHADMSRFPIDSQDTIVSNDTNDNAMKIAIERWCAMRVVRENVIYAVEIIGYNGAESELVEAWQLTRPAGWTRRETKMVWETIHDAISSNLYSNVVAYVFNATLDDAMYHCESVMKFQSYVITDNYPEIVVHDITRNMNALMPWEYSTRRHTRTWHLVR